jgi:hypothetical protein
MERPGRAVIIALVLTSTFVIGDPELALAAAISGVPADRAAEAGIPAPLADALAARAAERGLPVGDAFGAVKDAGKAGVPPRLVAEKILEGLAKGVPPPRVLAVARDLTGRLVTSRELLDGARRAGLAPEQARDAALADLAGALGQGVTPEAVRALVAAAPRGRCDAVVAAARTLGELARRGVAVDAALPLAQALAARSPADTGEVAILYDEYRREGGDDPAAFLEEAKHRVDDGVALGDLVDHFGGGAAGALRRAERGGTAAAEGRGHGADPGDVPGLEHGAKGRGHQPKKPK